MQKLVPVAAILTYLLSAKSIFGVETINLANSQGNVGIPFGTSLGTILGNSITLVFTVAAVLVLAWLIWGGIEWVTSGGDKEKVGNARKRIIASLFGLAIIGLAFLIVNVVGQIFGFNILTNLTIPNLADPK